MEQQHYQEKTYWKKNRTLTKGLLIALLTLLMLIPTAYIMLLISERKGRQIEVTEEISKKWAGEQTVIGPVLTIPYSKRTNNAEEKEIIEKNEIHVLPEKLNITGKVYPDVRHRSIYKVTVYRSALTFSGNFDYGLLEQLHIAENDVDWENVHLSLSIDDPHGLEESPILTSGTKRLTLEASTSKHHNMHEALSANISQPALKDGKFSIDLKLKGTQKLFFTPTGRSTRVKIKSGSSVPAFGGKYLPDNSPKISDTGFTANWKILQVSRGYPKYWYGNDSINFYASSFGVKLIQEADHYTKTERSVKYAILAVSLTFLVFFFIEMLQKKRVHPMQYVLVGFALVIFYTLLLSISEYTGFNIAYLIAASATILLITWYVRSIFRKNKIAFSFSAALCSLYAYIFFIIQLKDYALLFGSIGLFLILTIVMYYSKNIDWYHAEKNKPNDN